MMRQPGAARDRFLLVAAAVLPLAAGLGLAAFGRPEAAHLAFILGTLPVLAVLLFDIARSLREGRFGLDILAALSMATALGFGEPLAGNVVALMYAGGQQLERFAEGRARREMTALAARAPRTAIRREGEALNEVPVEAVAPGDVLLVRHADTVPADGIVRGGAAVLDLSSINGEAQPVRVRAGEEAPSGAINAGGAFEMDVVRPAGESTYAAIVRLVEAAAASRAPMARLADRYGLVFLLVSLALAIGAALVAGDPRRALAVLVVATPCPLILAVPVALMAGLSRTAKRGVLVKNGGALEKLARVGALVIDKTGTLTHGRAGLAEIRAAEGFPADEVLRLAASLDQASSHVVASALVDAAQARGLALSPPRAVEEDGGVGISGMVGRRQVVVGGSGFVVARSAGDPAPLRAGLPPASAIVAVAVDGRLAGIIALADTIREDASQMLAALRAGGVRHICLASGDRSEAVAALGGSLGLDAWAGELSPQDKVACVQAARRQAGERSGRSGAVMMVGDGVNDAPALAAADVGVAMGARGAAASAEVADVVLLVDRLDRLAEAMAIARRALAVARQSVFWGIGLSLAGMLAAAFGYLEPVEGALLQEAIDVVVILNAMRVLVPGRGEGAA